MTRAEVGRSTPGLRWPYVWLAGLVAGAIDITYACAFWGLRAGVRPGRIFQSVSAGMLGPSAFTGGSTTALLGLALHFGIALSVAVVYALAARADVRLVRQPWRWGAAYGFLVYGVMNGVVLPFSAAGPASRDRLWIGLTIAVHVFGIGVPCALGARAALRRIDA